MSVHTCMLYTRELSCLRYVDDFVAVTRSRLEKLRVLECTMEIGASEGNQNVWVRLASTSRVYREQACEHRRKVRLRGLQVNLEEATSTQQYTDRRMLVCIPKQSTSRNHRLLSSIHPCLFFFISRLCASSFLFRLCHFLFLISGFSSRVVSQRKEPELYPHILSSLSSTFISLYFAFIESAKRTSQVDSSVGNNVNYGYSSLQILG